MQKAEGCSRRCVSILLYFAFRFRVEVNGKVHDISPGGAWFEAGPEAVLALASGTEPTAFDL